MSLCLLGVAGTIPAIAPLGTLPAACAGSRAAPSVETRPAGLELRLPFASTAPLRLRLTSPYRAVAEFGVEGADVTPAAPGPPAPGPPAPAPPAPGANEIRLKADQYDIDEATRRIEAHGNVRVTFGSDVLTADRIVLDQSTQTVTAEGNIRHLHAGQETRAERLEWNYVTESGRASGALVEYLGVIVRARELAARPGEYQAEQVSLTTCDLPRPHYRLTARSITVTPGERIRAQGIAPWVLGTRLLTWPGFRYSLREGGVSGSVAVFPTIGYNSRDGTYIGRRLRLGGGSDTTFIFDGKLSLRRGFLGGVEGYENRGQLRKLGAVEVRVPAPNQRVRFLEIDRLPELGLLWVRQPEVRSEFLPIQVQDVRPASPDTEGWRTLGQVTLGYFRQRSEEFRGDVAEEDHGFRLDGRLLFAGPPVRAGGIHLGNPRLLVRGALYEGGDRLGVLGFGWEVGGALGRDVTFRLEQFSHWQTGRSRFLFDEVEIVHEWRPRVQIRNGLNTFTWLLRYDADRQEIFDQEFGIARVLHCIEPRLTYRTRRQQIGFELRVVALQRAE
jgi:hypothetical protein